MTGPSLKKIDAHSSIHEAALHEAKELNKIIKKCLNDGEREKALKVAEVIVEHWEIRTLKHAESEEEGLYKEMVEKKPELKQVVVRLTRDHDLMRSIVVQVKDLVHKNEMDEKMINLFESLIIIDEIHNEEEMNKLLTS